MRIVTFPRPDCDDKGIFLGKGQIKIIVDEDDTNAAIRTAFHQLLSKHNGIKGKTIEVVPSGADKFYVGIYAVSWRRDHLGYHAETYWVLSQAKSLKQAQYWIASQGGSRSPLGHWPKWVRKVTTKKGGS